MRPTFVLICFDIPIVGYALQRTSPVRGAETEKRSSIAGETEMGRLFVITLEGSFYSCKHCRTHLALAEDTISKTFHCRHGKAYLFDKVVNVTVGEKEDRMMITGMHTVVDIFCVGCGSLVGWKYLAAPDKTQSYKVGKYILERFKVLGTDGSNYLSSLEAQHGGSEADEA